MLKTHRSPLRDHSVNSDHDREDEKLHQSAGYMSLARTSLASSALPHLLVVGEHHANGTKIPQAANRNSILLCVPGTRLATQPGIRFPFPFVHRVHSLAGEENRPGLRVHDKRLVAGAVAGRGPRTDPWEQFRLAIDQLIPSAREVNPLGDRVVRLERRPFRALHVGGPPREHPVLTAVVEVEM